MILPAAPAQPPHFFAELLGLAGVVAVGDDHHRGARIDDAPRMPAIEGGEALADPGAAADALRHQRQLIDRARHVAVAQRRRDMREPGVEDESLGLAEAVDHAMQEADEERGVEAHRAGGVEQHDEPQRLDLAAAPGEIDQRAAMGDVAMDGAAQVEPAAAPAHLLAANKPRAHGAGKPRRQRVGRRDLVGIDDVAEVRGRQRFGARGAFAAAAAFGGAVAVAVGAPLDAIGQAERFLRHVRFGKPPRAGARFAPGAPVSTWRWRMPSPRQNASKISSKRSQSECVAQNSARNAGLSEVGRQRGRRSQHGERVAGFGKADAEAVVAQGAGEAGEAAARAERSSVIRAAAEAALEGCAAWAVALRGSLRSHLRVTEQVITPPCRAAARSLRA